jgi:hypothetical protein
MRLPMNIICGTAKYSFEKEMNIGHKAMVVIRESLKVLFICAFKEFNRSTNGVKIKIISTKVDRSRRIKNVSIPGLSRLGEIQPKSW